MFTRDYLSLRLVRLKRADEWPVKPGPIWFILPKGGGGKYACGSVTQRLSPGEVLAMNGSPEGRISAATGGEFVFWSFSLCLENLLPLFAGNEISLLPQVVEDFKNAKWYAASAPVAVECHRLMLDVPSQMDLGHRSQLLRIAATVLSLELKQLQGQRTGFVRADEHLVQIFESLSAEEILSLSVGELAARFSVSRRHLNRLFHRHFGFAVATLRMEMRLLKAVTLLRDPDAKVIRVAEQCGFNHLGLFNTCFKRRFGASPGQWRRTAGQNGEKPSLSPDADRNCPLQTKGLCPWLGVDPGDSRDNISPENGQSPGKNGGNDTGSSGELTLTDDIPNGQPIGKGRRVAG